MTGTNECACIFYVLCSCIKFHSDSSFLCCTANGKVVVLLAQQRLENNMFSLQLNDVSVGRDYPFGDGIVTALHWIEIGDTDVRHSASSSFSHSYATACFGVHYATDCILVGCSAKS